MTTSIRPSVALACLALAACDSNPPAMQPGALDARAKVQRCCDEVHALYKKNTPEGGARSDASKSWEAAGLACQERLGNSFDNDVGAAIAAIQKAAGKDDISTEAPSCKK